MTKHDCWWCKKPSKCICLNGESYKIRNFNLPSDREILKRKYYEGVAWAVFELKLSRQVFVDWCLKQLYNPRNRFYKSCGKEIFPILICDFYNAFNDDESFRAITDLTNFALVPPKQNPPKSHLKRLQLISLAIMASRPDLARYFLEPDFVPPPFGAA